MFNIAEYFLWEFSFPQLFSRHIFVLYFQLFIYLYQQDKVFLYLNFANMVYWEPLISAKWVKAPRK